MQTDMNTLLDVKSARSDLISNAMAVNFPYKIEPWLDSF